MKRFLFLGIFSFLLSLGAGGQELDSFVKAGEYKDSSMLPANKSPALKQILKENIFLNSDSISIPAFQKSRKYVPKNVVFYFLAFIVLMLGVLKVTYSRYFNNLIRVFFNTSLRQNQLTEQLLQAKLPSMLFNLFFVIISGWYVYLLLNYFGKSSYNNWDVLLLCILSVLIIYLIKFCTLKIAGWLTGYTQEAETYIFMVFLINKILAVCLVPIVVIMAFSGTELVKVIVIVSFVIIILSLILRFFRSYGLLQTRLTVSRFHFSLYLVSIEIIPLLLIYKAFIVIMSKSL